MNTLTRWAVRPSNFPLGAPGDPIGYVDAADRVEAQTKAEDHYGRGVVVEMQRAGLNDLGHSRQNGSAVRGQPKMRPMSSAEIDMARALGRLSGLATSRYKSTIRRLHAESFKASPTISSDLATVLRSAVRQFGSQLPPAIVELAAGGES